MKDTGEIHNCSPECVSNDPEEAVRRLLGMLCRYIDTAGKIDPFWEKFKLKLHPPNGGAPGAGRHGAGLLLIHSYINNIQELFEEHGDTDALRLLAQIEVECC